MSDDSEHTASLQNLRLKGRFTPEMLATSLTIPAEVAQTLLANLVEKGEAIEANGQFRLSPAGREALAHRVVEEREGLDATALAREYEAFHPLNSAFKALVTDWQIRDGEPNDHTDAAYDSDVLGRLSDLDRVFAPQVVRLGDLVPRLKPYPARFARALANLQADDLTWFARPILDSYHTVWFELHEELIGLLGLSRNAEAEAGRA